MRLRLICVGKVKEPFLSQGCSEFYNRIKRDQRIELIEIKDSNPEAEGQAILEKCKDLPIFAFSEEGNEFTSPGFSDFLKGLEGDVAFVIGGPDGLSQDVKDRSKMMISLSRMTFTHEMARMFLLEQIYRGLTIIAGKPYHR